MIEFVFLNVGLTLYGSFFVMVDLSFGFLLAKFGDLLAKLEDLRARFGNLLAEFEDLLAEFGYLLAELKIQAGFTLLVSSGSSN